MISLKRLSLLMATFAFTLTSAVCAFAQQPQVSIRGIRPSQKASVMQTIGVTDVTITYSRPGVKGRKIWGDPPAGMESRAQLDQCGDPAVHDDFSVGRLQDPGEQLQQGRFS